MRISYFKFKTFIITCSELVAYTHIQYIPLYIIYIYIYTVYIYIYMYIGVYRESKLIQESNSN